MGYEVIVPMVIALASGAYQYHSSRQAAEEQEEIAEANAKREEMEAEEMAQRAQEDAEREQSLARARAAASGASAESESTKIYTEDLKKRSQREIDWMRKSGASRAGITRREGSAAARATRAEGVGALFKGAAGAANEWSASVQ